MHNEFTEITWAERDNGNTLQITRTGTLQYRFSNMFLKIECGGESGTLLFETNIFIAGRKKNYMIKNSNGKGTVL